MRYLKHNFNYDSATTSAVVDKSATSSTSSFNEFKQYADKLTHKIDSLKKDHVTQQEWIAKQLNQRMSELRKMFRRKGDVSKFKLESQPKDIKDKILNLASIPSHAYRHSVQMSFTSKKERLKSYFNIVLIMIKSLMRKRKYFLDKWQDGFDDEVFNYNEEMRRMQRESLTHPSYFKSALTHDAIDCLRKLSYMRTQTDVKKIKWNLERLKAFDRIIPLDMQDELAMRVTYEKYENGRIIAEEHKLARRIYFLISGKIKLLKKFDLSSGSLFKNVGFLNKGDTTDPEEVERGWIREHTLVSYGVTELLCVDFNDLLVLRNDYQHFPFDFLKSVQIFAKFPFEKLMIREETLILQYYSPKRIIQMNAEKSPWLYVVKSGLVKVLKSIKPLTKHDVRLSSSPRRSHYSTPLNESGISSVVSHFIPLKRAKSVVSRPIRITPPKHTPVLSRFKTAPLKRVKSNMSFGEDEEIKRIEEKSRVKFSDETFEDSKTLHTYVAIDQLVRGSVFGLNYLNSEKNFFLDPNNMLKDFQVFKSNNDNEKLILMSEGCELILLSKGAFIKYADSSTICLIENLSTKFLSEASIRQELINTSKWHLFKKDLLTSLTI